MGKSDISLNFGMSIDDMEMALDYINNKETIEELYNRDNVYKDNNIIAEDNYDNLEDKQYTLPINDYEEIDDKIFKDTDEEFSEINSDDFGDLDEESDDVLDDIEEDFDNIDEDEFGDINEEEIEGDLEDTEENEFDDIEGEFDDIEGDFDDIEEDEFEETLEVTSKKYNDTKNDKDIQDRIDSDSVLIEKKLKDKELELKKKELDLNNRLLEMEKQRLEEEKIRQLEQKVIEAERRLADDKAKKTALNKYNSSKKPKSVTDNRQVKQTENIVEKQTTIQNKEVTKIEFYSTMEIESLYLEVRKFMSKNNVNKTIINKAILEKEFGSKNISKLILKCYLISTGKGITIGR